MTPVPWIQRTALALTLVAFGCDSAEDGKTKAAASDKKPAASKDKASAKAESAKPAAKAEPAKPEPKAEPEPAKGTVVLEEVELEGLGKIKMPKGYKELHEKGWKYDLGDFKSISVSWEPHGAKNLKAAKTLSKVLANAPTEKTAETLESGYHEIERVRDSDGFSFVAVFSDSWYVKCSAPAEAMEHCRDIVRSKE